MRLQTLAMVSFLFYRNSVSSDSHLAGTIQNIRDDVGPLWSIILCISRWQMWQENFCLEDTDYCYKIYPARQIEKEHSLTQISVHHNLYI